MFSKGFIGESVFFFLIKMIIKNYSSKMLNLFSSLYVLICTYGILARLQSLQTPKLKHTYQTMILSLFSLGQLLSPIAYLF